MDDYGLEFQSDRDSMIQMVEAMSYSEMSPVLSGDILSAFLVNPREERMYFTDEMQNVIGVSALQEMILDTFALNFPPLEQQKTIEKYRNAFSDMSISDKEYVEFEHSLINKANDVVDVLVKMQLVRDDKTKYIQGVFVNRTRNVEVHSAQQLFGEGIDAYFITVDLFEDIGYLSNKFREDFDLPYKVENFAETVAIYVPGQQMTQINNEINNFLSTHEFKFKDSIRLLAPGRGEVFLRIEGFSDAGRDGKFGEEQRYITCALTDVSDYVRKNSLSDNIIEGTSAITFMADATSGDLIFSENIHDIYPDMDLVIRGDIVEILSSAVVADDKKRVINTLHKAINEKKGNFSIEYRIKNSKKKTLWIAVRGKVYLDSASHDTILVGMLFDLTQMNEVREDVEKKAQCHEVTGLPIREKLVSDADKFIKDKDLLSMAVVLIDINDFHTFNDRYGITAGNEILMALTSILKSSRPEEARVYHIGTDTFALLWPHATQIKAKDYMTTLLDILSQPLEVGNGSYFVNVSMAAAFYPLSPASDELLINAEIALHKVKQEKQLKYAIYSPVDKNELKERLDFESHISQCIRNNMENFQLYYQPLIDAQRGVLIGAEALLRWQAPTGELVNPEKVVRALEATDQMADVSNWILHQAIAQCSAWINSGAPSDFYVHINATADDLIKRNYADEVVEVLNEYNLSPDNILIEITETSLVKNMGVCKRNLNALHAANIRTALDDFGSGYSSFNYLKELPVDEIKIDKSFVDDMETVEFNKSFISAITMLAHSIDKKVVVEGIENENQANAIREMGADFFQGYLFGKPMSTFAFSNQYFR